MKDVRTECPNLVTPCEEVDVAHMIWFENNNDRRRAGDPEPSRPRVRTFEPGTMTSPVVSNGGYLELPGQYFRCISQTK